MTLLGEDKITEMFGTPAEMAARLDHFERDVLFLWNNIAKWRELYMDKWIAVYDEEVIAVADDLDSVDSAVRRLSVPRGGVVLQPIRRHYNFVLFQVRASG